MVLKYRAKLDNIITKLYICSLYYIYPIINKNIKSKIEYILNFDETDVDLSADEQEEQALPGMHKYLQTGWYKYMIGRYLFSIKYIKDKEVLDTACGLGWGSYLISDIPKYIMSVDIDDNSLSFAKEQWISDNIDFNKLSILELNNITKNFDVVLSYEVIEHLTYYEGLTYIKEVSKVIKSNGIFILSSYFPDIEEDARIAEKKNRFHPHIYTKKEIKDILNNNEFTNIKFYGDLIIKAEKI